MTRRPGRMRLFSGPLSMFGAKAEIAALEKGLDFELVMVPFEEKYEPKHPEVLRINPKQQVPVLIHGDLEIFDSTQIFEYLEDLRPQPPLWPPGPVARARARLLELKSDEVYFPHIIRLMGLQSSAQDPAAVAARHAAARFYEEIDALLADRIFSRGRILSRTSPSTWRNCSAPGWARRSPTPPPICFGGETG
jgi:glutathione S-transferase